MWAYSAPLSEAPAALSSAASEELLPVSEAPSVRPVSSALSDAPSDVSLSVVLPLSDVPEVLSASSSDVEVYASDAVSSSVSVLSSWVADWLVSSSAISVVDEVELHAASENARLAAINAANTAFFA